MTTFEAACSRSSIASSGRRRARAAAPADLGALTLVDDDAMDVEIALGRLVRKTTEELDAGELAGVGARLGELAVGKALEGAGEPARAGSRA